MEKAKDIRRGGEEILQLVQRHPANRRVRLGLVYSGIGNVTVASYSAHRPLFVVFTIFLTAHLQYVGPCNSKG